MRDAVHFGKRAAADQGFDAVFAEQISPGWYIVAASVKARGCLTIGTSILSGAAHRQCIVEDAAF